MENAIVHLLLNIDPNHTISIIGIIATAGIAIYSIRKTAEASRVTNTYSEMKSCLMETVLILDKVLTLLDGVAKKVVYYRIPEKEIIETAHRGEGKVVYDEDPKTLVEKVIALIDKEKVVPIPKYEYAKGRPTNRRG